MGYTTEFSGAFIITPQLAREHQAFLTKFAQVRHMKRDPVAAKKEPDPIREAVGLDVGEWGKHYVGSVAQFGQDRNGVGGLIDFNTTPPDCPGLWCQWIPSDDGTKLEWDGGEKFYYYVAWLKYLIEEYLKPWGYALNGAVTWQGESDDDKGVIHVVNNDVTTDGESDYA